MIGIGDLASLADVLAKALAKRSTNVENTRHSDSIVDKLLNELTGKPIL